MQSMQKKAGQDTFGGRFGGRMSSPETKLKHLRRPNPPKQSRTCKTRGGKLWQPKPPCKRFGGRMNLRLSNLSSSRTQLQQQTISSFPSISPNMPTSSTQFTYTQVYVHRGPKLSNNPKQQNNHNTETFHWTTEIPVPESSRVLQLLNIVKGPKNFKEIRKINGVIYQMYQAICFAKVPMNHEHYFEVIDKIFRDILSDDLCLDNKPFGGKTLLLGGDFRQILPVVVSSRDGITKTFKLLDVDKENNWIEVPNELIVSNDVINFTNIICTVYKNFCKKYDDSLYLKERMIVNPTNEILDEINKKCCICFYFICKNSFNFDELEILYPFEFLNTLEFNCFPQYELNLKLYVALSRVTSKKGIKIALPSNLKIIKSKRIMCIKNVVYLEIFNEMFQCFHP
ncbi:hypothetical protein MANES_10G075466v8 [Manihot esculenta]|uniref:Uncharacterized protein n=1 Tax=Manihot esculenta TaxID=3983 RepID=A0ACB7GZ52_MANES|nr:hypothetical protein MANES_10G075466v8 [Manihot esculenta]